MQSLWLLAVVLSIAFSSAAARKMESSGRSIKDKVDALLAQMTIAEKIGQMNQYNDGTSTGIRLFGIVVMHFVDV
jgi:hypothetical protein